ncbi:hypothetical protein ACVVJ5_004840, partial [Salmonella enterica subsp. diarizonae serovar 48:r:z]
MNAGDKFHHDDIPVPRLCSTGIPPNGASRFIITYPQKIHPLRKATCTAVDSHASGRIARRQ